LLPSSDDGFPRTHAEPEPEHFAWDCPASVNSADAVCDQKISKFFVSHLKESMAGHMGISGVY
jgi:hypothetical protein